MALKTEQDFIAFLNRYGHFSDLSAEMKSGWKLDHLRACQKLFASLAKYSPPKWNQVIADPSIAQSIHPAIVWAITRAVTHRLRFDWNENPHKLWRGFRNTAVIESGNVFGSIITTLEVDHLRGARFRPCKRPDCQQFFELTSKHKRIYCSQACAHLQTVRNHRQRLRSAASKSKTLLKGSPLNDSHKRRNDEAEQQQKL